MILKLQDDLNKVTSWNNTLHRMLYDSKMFDVQLVTSSKANQKDGYLPYPRMDGVRNSNWSTMELDGVLIGLDTWDTLHPTMGYESLRYFNPDGYLKDVQIIIKIQYHKYKYWDYFVNKYKKRVTAWTVMPCHHFPINNPPFKWEYKEYKYMASVTGRNNRFGRKSWVDWAVKNSDDFYAKADYKSTDPQDIFMDIMKNCKWGLSLHGRSGAEKNRRECEFSSCGMPLALNYKPEYPFPMIPNEHYVYLEKPEDMAKLRDIDPLKYAKASRFLFQEYFSPVGMAKTLIKIVKGEL